MIAWLVNSHLRLTLFPYKKENIVCLSELELINR